jgi:hypothetical protein
MHPEDIDVYHLWSNTDAEQLYRGLVRLMADIREDYFGPGSQ